MHFVRKSAGGLGVGFVTYLILSAICILIVFREAVWSKALLCPLDVAPNLYSKYKWLDPEAKGIPNNHYLVDMFDYDLPRQYLSHQGLQRAEFPWWDPYTHGGRPLVAEAHVNVTDPTRLLLYSLLPFATAYNWTRIVHSLLSGLGGFMLLRHLRFGNLISVLGALTYQFAGSHVFFFFPAHLQGSFLYYPWLWIAWSSYLAKPVTYKILLAGLACAGVFAAGNQQSHAYLVLFALCFCGGYAWRTLPEWWPVLRLTSVSMSLGGALAAPFLVPQIELYFLYGREAMKFFAPVSCLSGVASLAAIFPWALGSFRTLEIGKVIGHNGLGFVLYIGSAGFILALLGALTCWRKASSSHPAIRIALLCVATYLIVICSTPLLTLLDTRASGLAVLGLIVLSAHGLQGLFQLQHPDWTRKVVLKVFAGVSMLVLALNLFAFFVYPRIMPRVKEAVSRHQRNVHLDIAPRLRAFQVENLANEITFKNPETVFAYLSCLLLLLVTAYPNRLRRSSILATLMILNLVPLLLFANRFIPKQPRALWNALLAGGQEQSKVEQLLQADGLRLQETAPGKFEFLYPGVVAQLYRVHTLVGYSSFSRPNPLQRLSQESLPVPLANYNYVSDDRGLARGRLESLHAAGSVRFFWKSPNDRKIAITDESLNSITIHVPPGQPGVLIRSDNYYPGWEVEKSSQPIETAINKDGLMTFAIPHQPTDLLLQYRPRYHRACMGISGAAVALSLLFLLWRPHSRNSSRSALF